ncbi:N-acetylglucosaminyl-phosphatidylinositol de-N-acetylase-like [Galendromus occidentalis]|uniref:N-acetylglucosaminylphosphatidylinositol deacetylase n=1 Tax=Galendromus occidentalis TaxID=34638 RepID=A0AAJ6VVK9_9ACAR|nr:N-acetylglucosaminyl-phosphatidylinositol de-N-acetylase-like [Galendromus occidentalis]
MDFLGICGILLAIVTGFVVWIWIQSYLGFVKPIPGRRKLLVTAHPDDESMFFAPFIAWETSRGSIVHLICLSDGNFDGQGSLRRGELTAACHELGLPQEFLHLIDSPHFRDDPKASWEPEEILRIIVKYCGEHEIDAVVSFDSHGVSGHRNHTSIFHALATLSRNPSFRPCIYTLESVSILRKYFLLFDTLCTMLWEPEYVYSLGSDLNSRPQQAMLRHRSQLLWFRHLYMWTSKYMTINTLRKISFRGSR